MLPEDRDPHYHSARDSGVTFAVVVQTLVYGALLALVIYVVWRVLQAQGVV